ncbi:MAG: hypothetical protein U1E41_06285 [Paracoccus sp. (in: a-proteobacteria)]|jgi:hypothetical protein
MLTAGDAQCRHSISPWLSAFCALAGNRIAAPVPQRPHDREAATGRIITVKYPQDVLHAAQLPRHGAIARAARARAAEYRIIDIPAPCDGRGRTGPGPSAPAMAIGLIACLIAGSSDLHVLELGRDVT